MPEVIEILSDSEGSGDSPQQQRDRGEKPNGSDDVECLGFRRHKDSMKTKQELADHGLSYMGHDVTNSVFNNTSTSPQHL